MGEDPAAALPMLLSDEQTARRGAELVYSRLRGPRQDDERARRRRPFVSQERNAGDLGLDRIRRFRVGRRPLRRRSARLQETDLRDALRRGQRALWGVRSSFGPACSFLPASCAHFSTATPSRSSTPHRISRRQPYGAATVYGPLPNGIGPLTRRVATSTSAAELSRCETTIAVRPSEVIAIPYGAPPTSIGDPGCVVAQIDRRDRRVRVVGHVRGGAVARDRDLHRVDTDPNRRERAVSV